jgi:sulfane dehydrogenase subunit SoxC
VDVTLDGGMNWTPARMDPHSYDKAMHRFYHEFMWDGGPLLLQSRAHDSTGYVQPTKDALRAERGVNSIYHNNAIQTWFVDEKGVAENVEIS